MLSLIAAGRWSSDEQVVGKGEGVSAKGAGGKSTGDEEGVPEGFLEVKNSLKTQQKRPRQAAKNHERCVDRSSRPVACGVLSTVLPRRCGFAYRRFARYQKWRLPTDESSSVAKR